MAGSFASMVSGWFGGTKQTADLSKQTEQRPQEVDSTEGYPANADTLYGLYEGSIVGLQHASPLVDTPINVPVNLVSLPTPTILDDPKGLEALNKLLKDKSDEPPIITKTKCLLGTAWRWVRYDAKTDTLVWEVIPDNTIEAIGKNPVTNEIETIWTHERIKIATGNGQYEYFERKRKITKDRIEIKWLTRPKGNGYDDMSGVNVFGFMPIPFGHDCRENEWRGHSVLGRILRTLKAYHDVEQNRLTILADFKPKLNVQTDDPKAWQTNNGYTSLTQAITGFFRATLYLFKVGEVAPSITYLPNDATKPHTDALDGLLKKIIMGSGVPELFWGGLATGNHASTETQKDLAISYIHALQSEDNRAYEKLFNQSLSIIGFINGEIYKPVKMGWNQFDMTSADVKAKIFQTIASGINSLIGSAGATLEDVYYFLKKTYPDMPENDVETFISGLKKTAEHSAYARTDTMSQRDITEGTDDTDTVE